MPKDLMQLLTTTLTLSDIAPLSVCNIPPSCEIFLIDFIVDTARFISCIVDISQETISRVARSMTGETYSHPDCVHTYVTSLQKNVNGFSWLN